MSAFPGVPPRSVHGEAREHQQAESDAPLSPFHQLLYRPPESGDIAQLSPQRPRGRWWQREPAHPWSTAILQRSRARRHPKEHGRRALGHSQSIPATRSATCRTAGVSFDDSGGSLGCGSPRGCVLRGALSRGTHRTAARAAVDLTSQPSSAWRGGYLATVRIGHARLSPRGSVRADSSPTGAAVAQTGTSWFALMKSGRATSCVLRHRGHSRLGAESIWQCGADPQRPSGNFEALYLLPRQGAGG